MTDLGQPGVGEDAAAADTEFVPGDLLPGLPPALASGAAGSVVRSRGPPSTSPVPSTAWRSSQLASFAGTIVMRGVA